MLRQQFRACQKLWIHLEMRGGIAVTIVVASIAWPVLIWQKRIATHDKAGS